MSKSKQQDAWSINDLIRETEGFFKKRGIESPRLEAELLLAEVLKLQRLALYLRFDQPVMDKELGAFRTMVKRRAAGEPIAYILGHRGFHSIEVKCDSRALIPRSETELLVDVFLDRLDDNATNIIDIGTGTGAIGLAIATARPHLRLILIDLYDDALSLARENLNALTEVELQSEEAQIESYVRLDKRVGLLKSNLLDQMPPDRRIDAIISNPPYVSERTRNEVAQDVLEHEPHHALFAGEDGLDIFRRLIPQAYERLHPGGLLAVEIGYDQGDLVPQLFEQSGFKEVELKHDYSDHPRVVSGIKPH